MCNIRSERKVTQMKCTHTLTVAMLYSIVVSVSIGAAIGRSEEDTPSRVKVAAVQVVRAVLA